MDSGRCIGMMILFTKVNGMREFRVERDRFGRRGS